jgi:hypothetical protein
VIQIDGADMAGAQQSSTLYVNLPTEAIGDVQVKTGGNDATTPLGVGVVINISTKSGTDTLHAAFSTALQRRSWSSNNNPGATVVASDAVLSEASIGGPVRRERAWFSAPTATRA